eukprot:gene5008-5666_t
MPIESILRTEEKKRLGSRINEEVPEKKTGESTEKESYGANINEEVAQNVETEKSEAEERRVVEQEKQCNENDQSTSNVGDSSQTLKRKREQIVINSRFEKIGRKGRKKVRCKVCIDNPDVVLSHKESKQIPAFCTHEGGEIRKAYMDTHMESELHLAACRADRLKKLNRPAIVEDPTTIDSQISKANKRLNRKIGVYMTTVFNDAKRGTLSAWSWPSRQVAAMRADYFKDNGIMNEFFMSPDDFSLASTAALSPLKQLSSSPTNEQLRACHKVICPDLPLVDFVSEYKEASEMEHLQSFCTKPLLSCLASEKQYLVLTIAIARLVAAKPHSADAALDWITDKEGRARCPEKAKKQSWFVGVFKEAEDFRTASSHYTTTASSTSTFSTTKVPLVSLFTKPYDRSSLWFLVHQLTKPSNIKQHSGSWFTNSQNLRNSTPVLGHPTHETKANITNHSHPQPPSISRQHYMQHQLNSFDCITVASHLALHLIHEYHDEQLERQSILRYTSLKAPLRQPTTDELFPSNTKRLDI